MHSISTQTLLVGQHAAPPGPVDLTMMYVMHHAFRRDLDRFQSAARTVDINDRDRWRALHQRWRLFASALHHHHTAEDAGLWPFLLDRAHAAKDNDAVVVLDAMATEHALIDPALAASTEAFAALAASADEHLRSELGRSLDEGWRLLDGHMGHEEREAMALVQRYLTEADWQRVEREHFRPAYSPRETLRVVPWAMSGLPHQVRRRVLADAGPAMSLLWRATRRSFARAEDRAFGSHAS